MSAIKRFFLIWFIAQTNLNNRTSLPNFRSVYSFGESEWQLSLIALSDPLDQNNSKQFWSGIRHKSQANSFQHGFVFMECWRRQQFLVFVDGALLLWRCTFTRDSHFRLASRNMWAFYVFFLRLLCECVFVCSGFWYGFCYFVCRPLYVHPFRGWFCDTPN